ncbi:MAG: mercury(II) reductase [Thermoproteota archaeon]
MPLHGGANSLYDLVVVGGGAAGFSAAVAGAEAGARVLLVSNGPLGGTCVNFGCVPTKRMLHVLAEARRRGERVKLVELLRDARSVSERLRKAKYEDLLGELGVDYVRGRARFLGPGRLEVGGVEYRFRAAVVAVGAKTWRPPIEGLREAEAAGRVLDNETLMELGDEPESVVVVGGRAQGIEFSQIMARAGVRVTLLQRSPRLLPNAEPEASAELESILVGDGVDVRKGVRVRRVLLVGGRVRVEVSQGGATSQIEADYIFLATGRRPHLEGLGLENVGVKVTEQGFIDVDETLKASEGIYAAGDCIGEPMLEPVAAREGYVAALNALGRGPIRMDYSVVPRAVFTDPEYASVGLTERELARRLGVCACRVVRLRELPKAAILGEERGFIKMVVDPRDRRIVGVHMVGRSASEVIHEAALAIKAGMTVDDIIDAIHVFPTMSEALKYAALSFYRDVRKMPCCLL